MTFLRKNVGDEYIRCRRRAKFISLWDSGGERVPHLLDGTRVRMSFPKDAVIYWRRMVQIR